MLYLVLSPLATPLGTLPARPSCRINLEKISLTRSTSTEILALVEASNIDNKSLFSFTFSPFFSKYVLEKIIFASSVLV